MTSPTEMQDLDEAQLDQVAGGARRLVGAEMQNVVYGAQSTASGLDDDVAIDIKNREST
ncbi:MAG: hypothetical protein AAGC81_16665 [Pseudomonadota bacterium]